MVGRDVSQFYRRGQSAAAAKSTHQAERQAPLLDVQELRTPAHPDKAISFRLFAGEMVGLAGLVGAGRTEVLQTLFGITPAVSGQISISGQARCITTPLDAIDGGLALVPEDRKQQWLVLEMAVREKSQPGQFATAAAVGTVAEVLRSPAVRRHDSAAEDQDTE
jgi:ribose transport system ATP-binding protein